MSLQRRTPLRRTGPPKRRKRLKQVSDRTAAMAEARALVREEVFTRDGGCLLDGQLPGHPCWGRLTPHHLRKAGQLGPYIPANLVTLCVGHNGYVETVRTWARQVGLEMTRTDTYDDVWARLAAYELVAYTWAGRPLEPAS